MNKTYMGRLLLIVFMMLNVTYTFALPSADVKPIVQLKAFLQASKSLTADFKQVSLNEAGHPTQTSFGVFYLQRPGKFRWNYQKPFQQEIVSNSGKVWFYDTDLKQVTIKKIDESLGSTPALLLSGDAPLEDNYVIEDQGIDKDADMQWIKLTPKGQDSSFKYVLIGFSKGSIAGMELNDNFGQLTRIYFSNVLLNPSIKATVFDFFAPKDADVIDE